jgi:glycosyltransferase involved in cell wall biosynthesis
VYHHPYRYSPVASWTPWGFSEALEGGARIRKPLYAIAPIVLAAALRKARAVLARGGFDLVHVHWVVPNGPIGVRAASSHRLPVVVSLHGSDVAVAERSRTIGRVARWALNRTSAVTAPSGDLLSRAERLGASGILERVPYGADAAAFDVPRGAADALRSRLGFGDRDVVVAGVGRLIPVKGFEYLVDAYASAVASVPELRLVLVGDGDGRHTLETRVRELGVADTVVLTGAVSPREIPGFMAAADVVAVPSIRHGGYVDGLPNVALEAMAGGRPVVGSRVGGIPELVRDGENGLLVPEKDARALADALVTLARDPGLRERLGASGRAEIREERSWDAVGARFVEIYERVAGS